MITQEDIEYNFSLKCNYSHTTCKGIKDKLDLFHRGGGKVTNDFLTRYLLYLPTGYMYSWHYSCANNSNNWLPQIKIILGYLDPTEEDMIILAGMKCIDGSVFKIFVDRGVYIPPDILNTAIQAKNSNLTDYLIRCIPTTTEILEQICEYLPDCTSGIKYILEQKITPTTKALNALLKNKHSHDVEMMFKLGATFDESSLEVACSIRHEAYIKKILELKIVPDKKCYNAVFTNVRKNYYSNKVSYDAQIVANIIDILVVHGYKPDYDDAVTALKHGCYINDVKRFGIEFDSDFLEKCTEEEYYPYPDLNIKPTIKCLRIECGRGTNLKAIKQLVGYGIKPDIECLRNACKHKSNKTVIQYLVNTHGLKPDLRCLKNNAHYIGNVTLTYLLENMDIVEDKDKDKDNVMEEKDGPEKIKEASYVKTDVSVEDESKDFPFENSNSSEEEEPPKLITITEEKPAAKPVAKPKAKPKAKPRRTKKHNIEVVDDLAQNGHKSVAKSISKDTLEIPSDVPKNKRIKNKVNADILKIFSQKSGTKLSFLDLRKLMLGYITENNLIDKENKTLIKPDTKLCKVLKINKGKTVEFSKIDSLVSQCYK